MLPAPTPDLMEPISSVWSFREAAFSSPAPELRPMIWAAELVPIRLVAPAPAAETATDSPVVP